METTKHKIKGLPATYLITLIIVILATSVILLSILVPEIKPTLFEGKYSNLLNHQIIMLGAAAFTVIMVVILFGKDSLKLLSLKKRDGQIVPVPLLGIKPKANETWKNLGLQMTIIISTVTAIVIYFQVVQSSAFVIKPEMSIIVLLAFSNALAEELIFRFSFVAAGNKLNLSPKVSELTSGLVFGCAHYFGNPGGIPGVLMAAFIGWFLAKSMNETKGFFWAFFIHFIQDIIIFYALVLTLQ